MTGGLTQIVATALMLAAMQLRSFTVATAYVKSEPVLVAIMGFVFWATPSEWWRFWPLSSRRSGSC